MRLMARKKPEPTTHALQSDPTPQRLAKADGHFEVGDDQQGRKVIRLTDAPLDRMFRRRAISGAEYSALQRFRHHWYHAGLIPNVGSVDLNRVFASDPSNSSGMARSEAQAHHRGQWRQACNELGHRQRIVVDNVVCSEQSLEVAGFGLGWLSKPQAIAAASEILRDAGHRLAKLWGIG